MNNEAYVILSDGIPSLIDRAMAAGETFDAVIAEIKEQLAIAEDNRDEYETR